MILATDWLDAFKGSTEVERWETVAFRMVLAVAIGILIAAIRSWGGPGVTRARPALRFALVVLPTLVAMTMLIIADNVARAFGLVGALTIVRFRTFVEDTRDTVFIVFAVVAGMAAGAGNLPVCAVGVPLVGLVALVVRAMERKEAASAVTLVLEVRTGLGRDADGLVFGVLSRRGITARLVGVASAKAGASADSRYEITVPPAEARKIAEELSAAEGVQSVEIRES